MNRWNPFSRMRRRFALLAGIAVLVGSGIERSTAEIARSGFRSAAPGYAWSFPRDTGSHPAYKTEWWYYTGHLFDPKGREYGYELTFFRSGLTYPPIRRASAWGADALYFAHFAVTDPAGGRFDYDERASRGALGMAGAKTEREDVRLKDWSARIEGAAHRLAAEEKGWRIDLSAIPLKPPALNGENGYSQKGSGAGHASCYYSYARMKTTGTLRRNGEIIPVTGESWMDHEFSTDSLAPDEVGWDWFSIQLSDGEDLMLYRMRRKDGSFDPHSGGTWSDAKGKTANLRLSNYAATMTSQWRSPRTKISYPSKWRIQIPSKKLDIRLAPLMPNQELSTPKTTGVTYWEGAVEAAGTMTGKPIKGKGYVELTGYGGTLSGKA